MPSKNPPKPSQPALRSPQRPLTPVKPAARPRPPAAAILQSNHLGFDGSVSAPSGQKFGGRFGKVSKDNLRPRAANAGQALQHGPVMIDPPVPSGRFNHGELAAHLICGNGHVKTLAGLAD